jgi:trk system potassium uptake protein TrkH
MDYSPVVLWIASIAMFLGATNLILQYRVISERKPRWLLTDPEFRAFIGIVVVVSLIIAGVIFSNHDYSWLESLTHGFFQTISIISGTGFASEDFGVWVQPAQVMRWRSTVRLWTLT